jgi:hypothetical protein
MTHLVMYLGISLHPLAPDARERLEMMVHNTYSRKGFNISKVTLVDWERWRDEQPLAHIVRFMGEVVTSLTFMSRLFAKPLNSSSDLLTDISSVRKYITSIEFLALVNTLRESDESIILAGHSLGTIPALRASALLGRPHTVELISPPLAYKLFHPLFEEILINQDQHYTIYTGSRDWLSQLVLRRDTLGEALPNVTLLEGDNTHELMEYLLNIPHIAAWRLMGYGNYWAKIAKSLLKRKRK